MGTVNATLTLEVDPYTGIYVHYDVGTTDIDLGREQTFVPPASSFDAFGNPSEVHAIAVLPDVGLATVEFHAAEGNHLEVRDYPDAVPVIFGENQAAPQFALGASAVLCEPGALNSMFTRSPSTRPGRYRRSGELLCTIVPVRPRSSAGKFLSAQARS